MRHSLMGRGEYVFPSVLSCFSSTILNDSRRQLTGIWSVLKRLPTGPPKAEYLQNCISVQNFRKVFYADWPKTEEMPVSRGKLPYTKSGMRIANFV